MNKKDVLIDRSLYDESNGNMLSIPRDLIEFLDNANEAILFNQILYWGDKLKNNDGWLFKTYKELTKETGLSSNKLRRAKNNLEKKGYLNITLKTILGKPILHYKLNEKFIKDFNEFCHVQTHKRECTKAQKGVYKSTNDPVHLYNSIYTKNTYKEYEQKITNNKVGDDEINEVFKVWNESKIIQHITLTNKIKSSITEALKIVSLADFIQSIKNYSTVVNSDSYFFTTRWDIIKYIDSGIRNNSGFATFLDDSHPLERFKMNKKNQSVISTITDKFKPITEEFDEYKLADFKGNKYYGFNLDIIKNPWDRMITTQIYIDDTKEWDFGSFWQLELCIAAFIWHRKRDDLNLKQCRIFFNKWLELKDKFKKQEK